MVPHVPGADAGRRTPRRIAHAEVAPRDRPVRLRLPPLPIPARRRGGTPPLPRLRRERLVVPHVSRARGDARLPGVLGVVPPPHRYRRGQVGRASAARRRDSGRRGVPGVPHAAQYDFSEGRDVVDSVHPAVAIAAAISAVGGGVHHLILPSGEGSGDGRAVIHPPFEFKVQHDIPPVGLSPDLRHLVPHHARLLQVTHEVHPQLHQEFPRLHRMVGIVQPVLVISKRPKEQQLRGAILDPERLLPLAHQHRAERDARQHVAAVVD
mmetsp:Transcript_20407/g.43750  ORF Transcript_20407/g.43750 Transcript_20407/m.43750 type:complete len:266 (-) Transcript_20407:1101-1898(-)